MHRAAGEMQMRKDAETAFDEQAIGRLVERIFGLGVKLVARWALEHGQEHVVDRSMVTAASPDEADLARCGSFGEAILQRGADEHIGQAGLVGEAVFRV